jgi:hypothetical protein
MQYYNYQNSGHVWANPLDVSGTVVATCIEIALNLRRAAAVAP